MNEYGDYYEGDFYAELTTDFENEPCARPDPKPTAYERRYERQVRLDRFLEGLGTFIAIACVIGFFAN